MKKVLPGMFMFATLLVSTLSGCFFTEKECEHQEETIAGVAATCTEKGLTEGKKCSICQEILVAQQEIAALGHTEEKFEGQAPTCTEEGMVAYTHCTVCDKNFDAEGNELTKLIIDALGHTTEAVAEKTPTCTEEGLVAHNHCSVCDKNFDAEGNELTKVSVDALGHKYIDGECACGDEYTPVLSGEWTLVTEIKDGDNVLIGAPAYGKLLSVEKVNATSFYNKGVDYSAEDFTNVTDAETFTVTANADGTYTFTSLTGKVIALADQYSSLNDTGVNKSWALEEKSEGIFYLKNTGRNAYLEWYASKDNWSTYATSSLSDLFEMSFYAKGEATDGEHVHNYISNIQAATCEEDGLATYTCSCEDSFTEVLKATGHSYENGRCKCGELDPEHVHSYTSEEVAPTCQVVGHTKYTCVCGDTYKEDGTELADHIDTNLDITCDYEGCTKRILPPADSEISLFTAKHMIIVSLSNNYYLKGVVTKMYDAKSGIFAITDEAGDSILVRLPKNAEGVAYASWTTKVVIGDTIQMYGKPTRNTSTANYSEEAKVESGLLTVLKHEHKFSAATCTEPETCECLAVGKPALGHADENSDNSCDRCQWNMKLVVDDIRISTNTEVTNGVLDENKTSWTWSNDNFDVIVAKGTSTVTLYTTSKDYMQLKKQNTLTVVNKNGVKIHSITISTTNTTQFTNLKNAIGTQFEYTEDANALTVTIVLDSTENFVMSNVSSSTAYISGVEVVYEKQ